MAAVILSSDLEQLAAKAIADGRYRNTAEVVREGVKLLLLAEVRAAEFVALLESASRDRCVTLDDMLAEMDQFIHETTGRSA